MTRISIAILSMAISIVAHASMVTGQFRNATPNTQVEVFVPHRYIDGHDDHFRGVLDGQSRFSIEALLPEPQLVFLLFNDEQLPIFLAPSDTLHLKADAFQFPLSVHYTGQAAENNRLLAEYFKQTPLDFNEFNNIRFKIGQYWTAVELTINDRMENLLPNQFRAYLDSLATVPKVLQEKYEQQNPGALSYEFTQWFNAEITYFWAYHLLVYGHVYAGRHDVQSSFFDFLYEAPIIGESIGSNWYRQFLMAFMARQQTKKLDTTDEFWAGQYQQAGKILSGKPLAFFRSEVISIAFSADKYREFIPNYTHFLQTNEYPAYDRKVEDLYQKYARAMPGAVAPTFELKDANGKNLSLSQLRGKVVYLNFWASWCGACIRKMEFMDEYNLELEMKGIEIVNISIDENVNHWRTSLTEHQFKGKHLLASAAPGSNLALVFGVEAVPQYFIIGRNGNFVDKPSTSQPADIRLQLLQIAEKQ